MVEDKLGRIQQKKDSPVNGTYANVALLLSDS